MIFVRPLVLIALIQILIQTNKPFLCSGIYGAIVALFGLFLGSGLVGAVVGGAIAFVLSSVYFWLLDRFDGSIWWWIIAVGGLVIGLVLGLPKLKARPKRRTRGSGSDEPP